MRLTGCLAATMENDTGLASCFEFLHAPSVHSQRITKQPLISNGFSLFSRPVSLVW